MSGTALVGVVMGSDSDWPVMEAAAEAALSTLPAPERERLEALPTHFDPPPSGQ